MAVAGSRICCCAGVWYNALESLFGVAIEGESVIGSVAGNGLSSLGFNPWQLSFFGRRLLYQKPIEQSLIYQEAYGRTAVDPVSVQRDEETVYQLGVVFVVLLLFVFL